MTVSELGRRGRPVMSAESVGVLAFFVATALAITLLDESFLYVADARYEHTANPGQFLSRHRWIWDAQRGPGDPARYYSPFVGGYQTLLAATGLAPWMIERLTHVLYMTLAGTGARRVSTLVNPAPAWVGVIAGCLYVYSPYTTEFLLPSGLYFPYALAPWFVVCTIGAARRTIVGADAAVFALGVASVGFLNTASLTLAMLPTAVVALQYVIRGRARVMIRFLATAFGLTVLLAAPVVLVAVGSVAQLRFNLETTETAQTVGRTSSAAESWRGLGFWLTYFNQRRADTATNAQWYFTSVPIALASFVPATLAGYALVRSRIELRRTLAISAALAVVIMVGIHPLSDPSPLGRVLESGFDAVPSLRSFRSTYKVGSGLMLAVATLGAAAIAQSRRLIRLVLVAACVLAAIPFWTASLYPPGKTSGDMPQYWADAFAWFDELPPDDRVLVLPGMSRVPYSWGDVNDSLFDAHLKQPVVMNQGLSHGTEEIVDITWWLDRNATAPVGLDSSIAPVLQRLGIRWVIVQNDLNWSELGETQQSVLNRLRTEPGIELAIGFGSLGENTTEQPGDHASENLVRPVLVFEVRGSSAGFETVDQPLLIEGGGEAWPALASVGLLDHPIQNLATVEMPATAGDVIAGGSLVVTDGGRRRAMRVSPTQVAFSHTLRLDETGPRQHQTLTEDVNAQTVAVYRDGLSVGATTYGRSEQDWPTAWRAAAAADRDPDTAWAVWGHGSGFGETLTIDLGETRELTGLSVIPYAADQTQRSITQLRVGLFDENGREDAQVIDLTPAQVSVSIDVPKSNYRRATFTIVATSSATADAVGIREISLVTADGLLDAREWLRVPRTHLALERTAAPQFLFSSWLTDTTGALEDRAIRRVFETSSPASYRVVAQLRATDDTSDEALARLIGGPLRVTSATRIDGIGAAGAYLLDGDSLTTWNVAGQLGGQAEIAVDDVRASAVAVDIIVDDDVRRPSSVAFSIEGRTGSRVSRVDLPPEPNCSFRETPPCIEQIRVPFDEDIVSHLALTIPADAEANGRVRVGEVRLLLGDFAVELPASSGDTCVEVLTVDDRAVLVRASDQLTIDSLRAGVEVQSCDGINLAAGPHMLDTSSTSSTVRIVQLVPDDWTEPITSSAVVASLRSNPTDVTVALPPGPATLLVTDVPAHSGWRMDSVDADAPHVATLSVDAAGTFAVPARAEATQYRVHYQPQRWYDVALGLALAGMLACVAIIVISRRRTSDGSDAGTTQVRASRVMAFLARPAAAGRPAQVCAALVAGAIGYGIGGTSVAVVSLVAATTAFVRPAWVDLAAMVAVPLVALSTVVERDLDADGIAEFAIQRPFSHTLGLVAVMLWLIAAVLAGGAPHESATTHAAPTNS